MTHAAHPSPNIACMTASLIESLKVECTDDSSIHTSSASLPGWAIAKSVAIRYPLIAAAQPMNPMSDRSVDDGRPRVSISSQSRLGPRKPVLDTMMSLLMSFMLTWASAIARLQTSVTSGMASFLNLCSRCCMGMA